MLIFCTLWTVLMLVLVMIPVFRLINCDQIVSIMIYFFPNIYTFPGFSNNLNCMDYEFLQQYAPCLDSIYVLLVVTNIYFVPLFFVDLYFSHCFTRSSWRFLLLSSVAYSSNHAALAAVLWDCSSPFVPF